MTTDSGLSFPLLQPQNPENEEEEQNWARKVAHMASVLLGVLAGQTGPTSQEPPSCRLELIMRIADGNVIWTMQLLIEPMQWYLDNLDPQDKITRARKWVDEVKKRAPSSSSRHLHSTNSVVKEVADYCAFSSGCKFALDSSKGCYKNHSAYSCAWPSPKKTGNSSPCCLMMFDEIRLPASTNHFILMARNNKDLSRDLLFLPAPVWFTTTYTDGAWKAKFDHQPADWPKDGWKGHYTNIELVHMPFFWAQLFAQVRRLRNLTQETDAVGAIMFNFGEWESKQADDPYALECHGHAHLHLSPQAHHKLCSLAGWEALSGRHYDPPNYAWDDACRLESIYLLPAEVKDNNDRLIAIENKLEGFDGKFEELKGDLANIATTLAQVAAAVSN